MMRANRGYDTNQPSGCVKRIITYLNQVPSRSNGLNETHRANVLIEPVLWYIILPPLENASAKFSNQDIAQHMDDGMLPRRKNFCGGYLVLLLVWWLAMS